MRIHKLVLTLGMLSGAMLGTASLALAQSGMPPADPLSDGQAAFGKIVGDAFHRPDPIIEASNAPGSPVPAAGRALRTSLEVPGAVWAAVIKPFADADAAAPPTPAPAAAAPARQKHRSARAHHHRVASQT